MRSLIGWLIIFVVLGVGGLIAEQFFGDMDTWGTPDVGDCIHVTDDVDGEPQADIVNCDDAEADARVLRRIMDSEDDTVCRADSLATASYVEWQQYTDDGSYVLCLRQLP